MQQSGNFNLTFIKDINMSIKAASTYEEFLLLIRTNGYETKSEKLGKNDPKFIAFRPIANTIFAPSIQQFCQPALCLHLFRYNY